MHSSCDAHSTSLSVMEIIIDTKTIKIFDGLHWNLLDWKDHVIRAMKNCMLLDPCVVPSSAQFHPDPAVSEIVGRSRKPQEYVNGFDIIIAMQKWQLERGSFLCQSDGNNCGPIACLKILELFHAIYVEAAREVYKKKNICKFVMAEWDMLVECCSNDLSVFVSEKLVDGTYKLCFCCKDSPSMKVINLPCCKASVHRQCVLEALQSSNQCVYCRKVLDPQDIIDYTPQQKAFSGEANVAQTNTLSQVKAAQESRMSGDANILHHTTTVPGLKAPPEANMSKKEVAANMNPPNIHFEPPVHDEVMNLHEKPVDGKDSSLSSMSIVGENNNNGLLFAPRCTTCFNANKFLLMSEKSVPTNGLMSALTALGSTLFFRQ
jgi:hypothetical protein